MLVVSAAPAALPKGHTMTASIATPAETTRAPKRGDLVRIPSRLGGDDFVGRVVRVVIIPGYYDPKDSTRYYKVEGYAPLVADAVLVEAARA